MKSYLIKDTTKQERIELIRQWVPADEAMEDCEIDLWDMDSHIRVSMFDDRIEILQMCFID